MKSNLEQNKCDILLVSVVISSYLIVAALFMVTGGFLAEVATKQVTLLSIAGLAKFVAIFIMLLYVAYLFIFGPILIAAVTSKWFISSSEI